MPAVVGTGGLPTWFGVAGMQSQKGISRRRLLKVAACGAVAVALEAIVREPNRLKFERCEVAIKDLAPEFDGYRIALLSDVHYPHCISTAFIQRAIHLANAFKPDLIAMPGDFVDEKGSATVPSLAGLFDDARATDGVFGVLGNHDHWLDAEGTRRELAKSTPIRLIENTHVMIERGAGALAIGGVGDLWEGEVDPECAFLGVAPDVPRILLSHNPDLAEEMTAPVRVDLQLSGHTHGGSVRLPFGYAPCMPSKYGQKFREGLVQGKSHRVYVTRGLVSLWHMRFMCPPDVTGITLRRAIS
ncbi:MAG: uncharacterized protein QOJ65_2491 [Fimbriimonadaceae bacterium]|jgi:predicted MPP superfamily phosphohydrolase|nr:uncharacterized protein [Fimbriimonadaceae bacterium]